MFAISSASSWLYHDVIIGYIGYDKKVVMMVDINVVQHTVVLDSTVVCFVGDGLTGRKIGRQL